MTQLGLQSSVSTENVKNEQKLEGGNAPESMTTTQEPSSHCFSTALDPAVGHPLQTAWTFWYDKKIRLPYANGNGRKESDATATLMDSAHYASNLKEIHTFDTVEEFYRAFSFIKKPSELPVDFNVSLFRNGSKPMWEEFPRGGMWIIRIKRGQTIDVESGRGRKNRNTYNPNIVRVPLIDVMWENLVLSCVGELFAMPEVVGVVLSVRSKENVLSVWNVDNENPAVRFRVGQKLREICALSQDTLIRYKDFQQAMKDCSSYRNAQKFLFTSNESYMKAPQRRRNLRRPITVTASSESMVPQDVIFVSTSRENSCTDSLAAECPSADHLNGLQSEAFYAKSF